MTEQNEFEVLDILVLISFAIQMDDHNNSRSEFNYIKRELTDIKMTLNNLLKEKEVK